MDYERQVRGCSVCSTTCPVNGSLVAGAWLFCLLDDLHCQWITSGRCVVVLSVRRPALSMDHERQVRGCSVCPTTCTVNGSRVAGAWLSVGRLELSMNHKRQVRGCSVCSSCGCSVYFCLGWPKPYVYMYVRIHRV